jgi:hypothetical protein
LGHFKKLQGNLEFHQNKCHPGNVLKNEEVVLKGHWTMGPGGGRSAKSPGRPARFCVSLVRDFMDTCLHKKGKAKALEKVGGGQTTWPAFGNKES